MKRVENFAFKWIPNLLALDLSGNQINHLSKGSFFGLDALLKLDLSRNLLSHVPSDALKVFRKYAPLQHIDLSFNSLDKMIAEDVFSAVSTSLKYLNLGFNSRVFYIENINWTSSLQSLEELTLICNDCSYSNILIDSHMQLPLLQKLQISTFNTNVVFAVPLCSLFPNLDIYHIIKRLIIMNLHYMRPFKDVLI